MRNYFNSLIIPYTLVMDNQITQLTFPPDFLDLGAGIPSLELLPIDRLEQAAGSVFAAGDRRTLQYGAEQGSGPFREGLGLWLTETVGHMIDPDSLMTTAGASSALDLLCTLYTEPGDVVFVEEPTYFLALRIFADHGLQIESIPLDPAGMNLDLLEEKLARARPRFVYTIPTYHNPASVSLSPEDRDRLVKLAQQYDFLILADEVYRFLGYAGDPPPAMAEYAAHVEQVISINSFSKILAPGLRLGWLQAHPRVIHKLAGCGMLDSGGGFNPFTSAVVDELIRAGGLTENITGVKKVYRQSLQAMDQALANHLPLAVYQRPLGGYYFWIQLPGLDTGTLREQARKAGVDFRPGRLFSSRKGLVEYLRLSFSRCTESEIARGIQKLAELVNA